MKQFIAMTMILAASACAQATQQVDSIAREGTKGVITETLATRFPQVPKQLITPFTDCIVDNADAAQVRVFAKSAVIGVDDTTVATVRAVLSHPETVQCRDCWANGSPERHAGYAGQGCRPYGRSARAIP